MRRVFGLLLYSLDLSSSSIMISLLTRLHHQTRTEADHGLQRQTDQEGGKKSSMTLRSLRQ